MHSTFLKSSDFKISQNGQHITHEKLLSHYSIDVNLAVIAPERVEGVDAALLILAYMTAYYNLKRIEGLDEAVYPKFYSLQFQNPPASYGMLDIWPDKKSMFINPDSNALADKIIENEISILILPSDFQIKLDNESVYSKLVSKINTVYLYSDAFENSNSDFTIVSAVPEIYDWILSVFNTPSLSKDESVRIKRDKWISSHPDKKFLTQSFKLTTITDHIKKTA
ncbi:MAG: hypothetical protein DWP97_04075 [Calditrichaeota bacterium]|nr:MAG: hypothetical protein DWP97_04075 [Calditrichota bacterium]